MKNIPKSPYLKPLRTYEGDVAEVMSHRQTSVASIAIAESKKMESEGTVIGGKPESSHSIKKIVIVLLSLIIIAVGVGGAYYLYSKSPLAKQGPVAAVQPQAPSSIIPRESYVVIPVDNIGAAAIISQIQAKVPYRNRGPVE